MGEKLPDATALHLTVMAIPLVFRLVRAIEPVFRSIPLFMHPCTSPSSSTAGILFVPMFYQIPSFQMTQRTEPGQRVRARGETHHGYDELGLYKFIVVLHDVPPGIFPLQVALVQCGGPIFGGKIL